MNKKTFVLMCKIKANYPHLKGLFSNFHSDERLNGIAVDCQNTYIQDAIRIISAGRAPTSCFFNAALYGGYGHMIQMTRKNTVVTGCYNSPKLTILDFETESAYLLPVSISYVAIYPQVDEYILEESTEVEF